MTTPEEIASGVADAKTHANPRVPASYVKMLVDRAARELGLSRTAFAARAELSTQTLSRAETGHPLSSVRAVHKLREVLIEANLDVPPVAVGTESWDAPRDPKPSATDSEAEVIRKNLIGFREAANFTPIDAASLSLVPYEKLRAYEAGETLVTGSHLKALCELYGHAMEDAFSLHPPAPRLDARRRFWFNEMPGAIDALTPAEREQLEQAKRVAAELSEAARKRYEAEKKSKRAPPKSKR